jgi:Uma2 family endonuclease
MATVATRLLTAKEFAALPPPADGSKQELVRGVVISMPPPPNFGHGECQAAVCIILGNYVRANRLGRITVESGLQTEHDPDSVRGPDVAFWSKERLPFDQRPEVYPDVAADLIVEVRSPSNTTARLIAKIREYFACGVRLVWVVDPDARTVTIYRQPGEGRVVWDDATLSGEDVLPGFTCPVAALFA